MVRSQSLVDYSRILWGQTDKIVISNELPKVAFSAHEWLGLATID